MRGGTADCTSAAALARADGVCVQAWLLATALAIRTLRVIADETRYGELSGLANVDLFPATTTSFRPIVGAPPDADAARPTDGPLTSEHAKAEALQLSRWADVIVFTETLEPGRGKPHPAAFEQLEREVGLRDDRSAYVADNSAKDFVTPHRLGWRTVRVCLLGSLHANVRSGGDIDADSTSLDNLDTVLAWDDSHTTNHMV